MASKKSLGEKAEAAKSFFKRQKASSVSDSERIASDAEKMDSKSLESDGRRVIRRSSMICSEGFDKYTFDCQKGKSSESYDHDYGIGFSSDGSRNSIASNNSSVVSAKLLKGVSFEQAVKKPSFFKPVAVPSLSGKFVSSTLKKNPDQTIPGAVNPSFKRVPEETIPTLHLASIPSNNTPATNIPLSFSSMPEKGTTLSPINNSYKSPPVKSSPYAYKHMNEEISSRNSPSLKTVPEEPYKSPPVKSSPYAYSHMNEEIPSRNSPLSLNTVPEKPYKSPTLKSSPYAYKQINEEIPSRNSLLSLNTLPEESYKSPPIKSSPYAHKLMNEEVSSRNSPLSLKTVPEELNAVIDQLPSKMAVSENVLSKTKPPKADKKDKSYLFTRSKSKEISADGPYSYNDANETFPNRTKPLSLNPQDIPQQSRFPRHSSMSPLNRLNSEVQDTSFPLQALPKGLKNKQNSSQSLQLYQDEPMPVRNVPLSLKPILSKHMSLLQRKNPDEACKVIKRDSVVHPDRVHMQGSMCINGRFQNPWPTWRPPTFTNILKFGVSRSNSKVPPKQELDLILPIVKPNFTKLTASDDSIRVTWIGHSTLLIQMHGLSILTDPIFSDRASPSQVIGPKRYRDPPCTIHDLPKINAVVISHSHYDHLDFNTVTLLNARFGSDTRWFVPLGLQTWMEDVGCENVVELDWWEENFVPEHSDTFFVFTPAQHWSKRTIGDDNKVLWGSWCIIGPKYKFFFAGDTGYCDAFKQIGKVHGPFDLSAIPIGAYEPRWFMKYSHINPEEAVKIHMDVQSKNSVAIHWGTFCLANEYYLDPPVKLRESLDKYEISPEFFFTMKHGESKIIASDNISKNNIFKSRKSKICK